MIKSGVRQPFMPGMATLQTGEKPCTQHSACQPASLCWAGLLSSHGILGACLVFFLMCHGLSTFPLFLCGSGFCPHMGALPSLHPGPATRLSPRTPSLRSLIHHSTLTHFSHSLLFFLAALLIYIPLLECTSMESWDFLRFLFDLCDSRKGPRS